MHLIDKNANVRAASRVRVAAEGGGALFSEAVKKAGSTVDRLFQDEHGALPHRSWIRVTEGPGIPAENIREAICFTEPPTSATEVLVNGDRRHMPSNVGVGAIIPVSTPGYFSRDSEAMPVAPSGRATFDGWDADTGLMVFTTK